MSALASGRRWLVQVIRHWNVSQSDPVDHWVAARCRRLQRLRALSDRDLARRGLARSQIVAEVFGGPVRSE